MRGGELLALLRKQPGFAYAPLNHILERALDDLSRRIDSDSETDSDDR